jgi:hypothetical protein
MWLVSNLSLSMMFLPCLLVHVLQLPESCNTSGVSHNGHDVTTVVGGGVVVGYYSIIRSVSYLLPAGQNWWCMACLFPMTINSCFARHQLKKHHLADWHNNIYIIYYSLIILLIMHMHQCVLFSSSLNERYPLNNTTVMMRYIFQTRFFWYSD